MFFVGFCQYQVARISGAPAHSRIWNVARSSHTGLLAAAPRRIRFDLPHYCAVRCVTDDVTAITEPMRAVDFFAVLKAMTVRQWWPFVPGAPHNGSITPEMLTGRRRSTRSLTERRVLRSIRIDFPSVQIIILSIIDRLNFEEVRMSAGRYRAAVIGCGKMSRGHAHAFANATDVDLVAGADVSEGARAAFAEEFGLDAMFEDPLQMLERERPNLVSICTWPPLHADLTVAAFDAGARAVWCEKPMAVHLADADRMIDAANNSGGVIIVNHQRRFVEGYRQARELLDAGAIGEITQITGICAGDTLTDGTHLIDMARFLNRDVPITSVFGAIEMSPMGNVNPDGMGTVEFNQTRKRYGHHVETGALGLLFFENGVRAHLEMGNLSRGGYQRFYIDGTEGRIELSGDRPFDNGNRVQVRRRTGELEALPATTLDGAMDRALAELLKTLEHGGEHTLSGASGRTDLEIVTAIYESARRRQRVALPIDVRESPLEAMLAAGEIPLN